MRELWVAVGVSFALVGCSTTQTSISDARSVPPAFVYANQPTNVDGGAKLTVVRDTGMAGGGCRFGLFVDGQRLADLDPKEMITVQVKPGQRILGVGPAANGKGLCAFNGSEMMREREANFEPGQERHFRMSMLNGGVLDLSPVTKP